MKLERENFPVFKAWLVQKEMLKFIKSQVARREISGG